MGEEIDKLSEAITVFEQKLPAEREVEVILKQVWELAAKHDLTPKSIRTDKPDNEADSIETLVRMATYSALSRTTNSRSSRLGRQNRGSAAGNGRRSPVR